MMINIFKIISWPIRRFLIVILSTLLSYISLIAIHSLGLKIPLLYEVIGILILLIIPGTLILRIFKLYNIVDVEYILYSVGLSISFLFCIGFLMNNVYPLIGFSTALSTFNIIVTLILSILILCFLCYYIDDKVSKTELINATEFVNPIILFVFIIPFFSIFGTYLLNFSSVNLFSLVAILSIAVLPILVSFDIIKEKYYTLIIFIISISLLYHQSLISMYVTGWDIQQEYYISNLVISKSIWNPTISNNLNAMLSISILPVLLHKFTNIELRWIFKVIYPLIYSLVPLGLYRIFQKNTDQKIAFLSVFFFMSFFSFYRDLTTLARQEIAELFLVLIILLFYTDISRTKRKVLSLIFSFSMVLSHYGVSYVYIFSLICVWILISFLEKCCKKNISFSNLFCDTNRIISLSSVLILIVFLLTWYIFSSGSSVFISIVNVVNQIVQNLSSEIMSPETSQGLNIIIGKSYSPLHAIDKYLHLITQLFITIGVLSIVIMPLKYNIKSEYAAFSIVYYFICFSAIVIPYLAKAMNTSRLYHITLIFLSPYCLLGGLICLHALHNFMQKSFKKKYNFNFLIILSIFLSFYLLFNSGFIYEIFHDNPTSISLNSSIDSAKFNTYEIYGANWLNEFKSNNLIYADGYRWLLFNSLGDRIATRLPGNMNTIPINSYIYLGTYNLEEQKIFIHYVSKAVTFQTYLPIESLIGNNKIYDNHGTHVYIKNNNDGEIHEIY